MPKKYVFIKTNQGYRFIRFNRKDCYRYISREILICLNSLPSKWLRKYAAKTVDPNKTL